MNYYKLSRSNDDLAVIETGPYTARVEDLGAFVTRTHDLFAAEQRIRAEWNRYVGNLILDGAKTMLKAIINRLRIARTETELNSLDDRLLADIGLYRSDITYVARKLAESTTEPVDANTVIAPVNTVAEVPAGFTAEAANTDEQREAA